MPDSQRLFLSYGRGDDAAFVQRLFEALVDAGFDVWYDRECMPSRGLTFVQEIRDAIERCNRLLLVAGPHALGSEYVRAEWQFALVAGKVVNPVLRLGTMDTMPAELRNIDAADLSVDASFAASFARLVHALREPVAPLGEVHGKLPAPPPHYRPRPDDLTALANRVQLDTRHAVVPPPAHRLTVLHGMAGVGKSVLAASYAGSFEARRAFADGVLWLPVGQRPNVDELCRSVEHTFTGASLRAPVPDPATRLRTALADKACLIVLDDVWDAAVVEPLANALGPRARLLVTSRDAGLTTSFGAQALGLDVLSDDAALAHLADWSGKPVERLPAEARAVARECGALPFALALAGATAADGMAWSVLLERLRAADLGFMCKTLPNYAHPTLLRSLHVGVDHLERQDRDAARRYRELVVLPGGTSSPAAAIETLWGETAKLTAAQTQCLLVDLRGKALLRLDGDSAAWRVSLHDLQHDYLRAVNGDAAALVHRRIAAGYARRCGGDWAALADDGYVHDHLARHLAAGGDSAALDALVDRRWMGAQFARNARPAFVRDATRLLDDAAARRPPDIVQSLRAALMIGFAGDLMRDAPPDALYTLAACGHLHEALDHAALLREQDGRDNARSMIVAATIERGDAVNGRALLRELIADCGGLSAHAGVELWSWAAERYAELGDAGIDAAAAELERCLAQIDEPFFAAQCVVRLAAGYCRLNRPADARAAVLRAWRALTHWPDSGHDADWHAAFLAVAGERLRQEGVAALRDVRQLLATVKPPGLQAELTLRIAGALVECDATAPVEALERRARVLLRRVKMDADRPRLLEAIALLRERRGDRRGAAQAASQALAAERDAAARSWRRLNLLADAASARAARGDSRGAMACARRLERRVAGRTDDAAALSLAASAWLEVGAIRPAAEAARRAIAAAPDPAANATGESRALAAIAIALAAHGHLGPAVETLAAIDWENARHEAAAAIVLQLGLRHRIDDALRLASQLGAAGDAYGLWTEGQALCALVGQLVERRRWHDAHRVAAQIRDVAGQAEACCALAMSGREADLLAAAQALQPRLDEGQAGVVSAARLVEALLRVGMLDRARSVAEAAFAAIGSRPYYADSYLALGLAAALLARSGDRRWGARLRAVIDGRDAEYVVGAMSRAMLGAMPEASAAPAARRLAALIETVLRRRGDIRPQARADACLGLARFALDRGEPVRACDHLRAALGALVGHLGSHSTHLDHPRQMLTSAAELLARHAGVADALTSLEALGHEGERAWALAGIARATADGGSVRDAERIAAFAAALHAPGARAEALVHAALGLRRAPARARALLCRALQALGAVERDTVHGLSADAAEAIAALDHGRTLLDVHRMLIRMRDEWRPAALAPHDHTPHARIPHDRAGPRRPIAKRQRRSKMAAMP